MVGLLPRLGAGILTMIAGGVAGAAVGDGGHAGFGACFGGMVAFAVIVIVDSARGARLMRWLRGPHEETAPRDTGFWGEVAYRIERSLLALQRAAQAERTRLAQFVAAMEASPNGVLLLDAADQIDWCNAKAAEHFGLDPRRDRGQPVTNLIRAPAFVSYLQARDFAQPLTFLQPHGRGSVEVLIRLFDGTSKLVLSKDQTERERADAMRRDFVANVSHEIRTPLTVLSGSLQTMRDLPLSDVERKRVITLMTQQAKRMDGLVGDLLILARLEGSPRPPADKWVRLSELLSRVETEARALSAGHHHLVIGEAGDTELAGTEGELQSAIANLVTNAVRYTGEGGTIEVTWHARPNGGGALSVADTGHGIPREHLPRLTERFYRVDGSRSRESGGTGLGLAIVKHVIQRHGGELDIESEVGVGSTFRLVFPGARVRRSSDERLTATAVPTPSEASQ